MNIFIEKAILINRAPFNNVYLQFSENEISVLSAINGKGKTTIISHIVDAFYELVKPHFSRSFEGIESKYYRVSSNDYSLDTSVPSLSYIRFKTSEGSHDFLDIRGGCTEEEYNNMINLDDKIPFSMFESEIKERGLAKKISTNFSKELITKIFKSNIMTYFPVYRYEKPGYLNDPYQVEVEFNLKSLFSGQLRNPIEVVSGLPQLANWIMDIVLDLQYSDSTSRELKDNIDKIISFTLNSSHGSQYRFGIGPRGYGNTRIQIVDTIKDTSIYPSIFNMSSGESAILSIFGELLRQADNIGYTSLEEIHGIVLIDEIDKHLHIKLQKEVLPHLLALFPNVQFIVSSHSPFLSMGLNESLKARTKIIDLDNYGISSELTDNKLYSEVYDLMINENSRFKEMYNNLLSKIDSSSKTLLISEGKTDILYIQKAINVLQINDLEFDYIEPECQPDGFGSLQTLLEKISQIKNSRKIIGIFDRDEVQITNNIEKDGQKIKEYGNNVYGICIDAPDDRVQKGENLISIEFLFTDDEITTWLDNNTRLFIGTEFSRPSLRHNSQDYILKVQKGKGKLTILENNGGQAVYNLEDQNVLAKKIEFANAIMQDEISITRESWNNFNTIFEKIREIVKR